MEYHTIFFHGWGFDRHFWHKHIKNNYTNHSVALYDRGYFTNRKQIPPLSSKYPNQCVAHSTGLFFAALEYDLSMFDSFIVYAAFKNFTNKSAAKTMRLNIVKNPLVVLKNFYKLCGLKTDIMLKNIESQHLQDDLKLLEIYDLESNINWKKAYNHSKFQAYHGALDNIQSKPFDNAVILNQAGHLCNLI